MGKIVRMDQIRGSVEISKGMELIFYPFWGLDTLMVMMFYFPHFGNEVGHLD